MSAQELSPTSYIGHHLTNRTISLGDSPFWTLHVDTVVTSALLGIVAFGFLWLVVRGATAGVPGKRQAFVELAVGFVDDQVKGIFHGDRSFITPLALTVFVWVILMNAMDFLPVDIMAWVYEHVFHQHNWRQVPTADVNTTFALALSVWVLMIFYSIKVKGPRRLDTRAFLRALRIEPAAVARQLSLQHGRVRLEAAVALAAAVRQHVCRRDHFPAPLAVGRDRPRRNDLRRAARRGLGDLSHPDRRAAGFHFHDAHGRLSVDGARKPLTLSR